MTTLCMSLRVRMYATCFYWLRELFPRRYVGRVWSDYGNASLTGPPKSITDKLHIA